MTAIYGVLGIDESERRYLREFGQKVIFEAVNQVLQMYSEDLRRALAVFVEEETSDAQRRYMLPGGGTLQRRGGQAQSAAVKTIGYWDVAFPLEEWGDQIAADRVDYAYMTVQDLDRHLRTVMIRDANTVRTELLRALFNNSAWTFQDPIAGTLTVQPLANGDAVLYPPVLGSDTEAQENHYIEAGYTNITDTQDPYELVVDELEEHFGAVSGGEDVVAFINPAQVGETLALTDFIPVVDNRIQPGQDTSQPVNLPNVPGRVLGRHARGIWVVEWRWVPQNYILGLHLNAPAPAIVRVDPDFTGLPRGLTLVAESDLYPFTQSHYSRRFGIGVGNRLNGVVVELGNDGSFDVPSQFA